VEAKGQGMPKDEALKATGPRYRAVMTPEGRVRLWVKRGRKSWYGFDLRFGEPTGERARVFRSRADADEFLKIVSYKGYNEKKNHPRFADQMAEEVFGR
jgi:hypothetical protein